MKRFWIILLPFFLLMPALPLFSFSLLQNHIPTISSTQSCDATQTGSSPSNSAYYDYDTPGKLLACATFRFPGNSLREEISFLNFFSGQSGNELENRLKQVGNLDPTKRLDQLLKGTGKLDALKRDPNLKVPGGVESLFTKSLKEIANLLNNSQWKTFTKHLFRGGSDITHGL